MAAQGREIPGIGIAMMTFGGFLMYIGIRDVPFLEGLREITSGRLPTPREKAPTEVEFQLPEISLGGGSPGAGGGGEVYT